MSSYSDQLKLIRVWTSVEIVVVAKDYSDAKQVVMDNYCDIIDDMLHNDSLAKLGISEFEDVYELDEDSPLRGYTPRGDDFGGQYTCEYYTTVEKNKRAKENQKRQDKIQQLIGGLDEESLQLLQDYFISET